MIMHVPLIGAPTLVHPRDSWVGIPGYGQRQDQLRVRLGGPQLMITTVEEATGHIDNYVEIGFAGVADTTDALGGSACAPIAATTTRTAV